MQLFSSADYLKIDISNNYGNDKKDWDERITWFNDHEDHLEELLHQAENPALYFAGVQAWRDVQAGKPIGYPISLDASSSGIQLLAVLTGDRSAAELCNVIDVGYREDAYTAVYAAMLAAIEEDSQISRDNVKRAIMTACYGSEAVPKEVFGEGTLYQTFDSTMDTLAPAVWALNKAFLDIWNPEAREYNWVLPDNFHVVSKVWNQIKETVHFRNAPYEVSYKVNEPMKEGRSLGANTTHSVDSYIVREIGRRCMYNPSQIKAIVEALNTPAEDLVMDEDATMVRTLWEQYEASGCLSARIFDYLKPNNISLVDPNVVLELINTLPAKPFEVISIHDCWRCLPSYGNDIRKQYNQLLYEIAKSNMLSYLLSQILNRPISINKLDDTLADEILSANYSLS